MAGRGYGPRGGGFARPENALKRAEELENVGQKGNALQVLHDVITSRKHRTWSAHYEKIMLKHIDLVVELKKRNYGKEALMQYRNMCQAVNIASLESVIQYYLKRASDKAEEAQSKAAAVTIDVADLEEDASPEDIMLSYVSGDKSKDRTDRELVTPWFRFLWEAYRSVLDILRLNPKLEGVYSQTARSAFHFCLQFKRTAEFRRLCDILRQHMANLINRYRESPNPDSLGHALETRFEQLKVACELEMWGEAFRSVEDIQSLIMLSKRTPNHKFMATYYARLTQIFAVAGSENHLYSAYAWLKLFSWTRKEWHKHLSQTDMQAMSSSVVLSMLSILPYDVRQGTPQDELAVEQEKERILRMASILGFPVDVTKDYRSVLSRQALLSAVSTPQMLALVPPEVRQVYDLLTTEFSPLELCQRMAPLLDKLTEMSFTMSSVLPIPKVTLGQYVNQLKQVTVLRLLKQLSEVFSTLKISTLSGLVPFMQLSEVETIIVDACKCDFLQVRIDHRHGTLHFGAQQLESDRVRSHLQLLAQRLSKAVTMVGVPPRPAHEKARQTAIQVAIEKMDHLHGLAIARKVMIEKRKEEQEMAMLEAEREEERRRQQAMKEAEMAEERRRREEALRREKERIEAELREREMEELAAMHESYAKTKGKGVASKVAALKSAEDKEALIREIHSDRVKAQEEAERKMARAARTLDHLERARREEEAPYLAQMAAARLAEERTAFEEAAAREAERHRAAWEQDMRDKEKLAVALGDKASFEAQIMARRREEFEELRKQRQRRAAERRAKRKAEIVAQRKQRYLDECISQINRRVAEIEEEEQRRLAEQRQKEEEERARKLAEIAEQQRRREAEIEARLREERERAPPAPAASAAAPAAGGKFVPSALRRGTGDSGPPASGRYEPPVRRDEGPGDRWGGPPRRDEDRDPRGGGGGDRWGGGGGGGAFGPRRDDGPPTSGRYPGPRRDDGPPSAAAPPAAESKPAPAPGKFVPPHLRNRQ